MNLSIEYALMDPTGNLTILVENPVPVSDQPNIASRLMELEPETEQVGFITNISDKEVTLRMAGGEFCGNASMSAAALAAERSGIFTGDFDVRIFGTDLSVKVAVHALSPQTWKGCVSMPNPLSIRMEPLSNGRVLPIVRFDGITHVILEHSPDISAAEKLAPEWCSYLHSDAIGLMFFDRMHETLAPLVYVPAAGTLCWENSCASGSSAVGAFLADAAGCTQNVSLHQPGGTLQVSASPEGTILLTGTTSLRYRRSAKILL